MAIGLAPIFFNQDGELEFGGLLLLKHNWAFKKNPKYNWGLGFTPAIFQDGEFEFTPWIGLNIGMKFGKIK